MQPHPATLASLALFAPLAGAAQAPPGEGPALGDDRITQDEIASGALSLDEIRLAGLKVFATPFNRHDGYGDGPADPGKPTQPGARPTLQNNGTFLRVNGLDAQTCMECHSVGSNATVPFTFAVGGVGGSNNNALFQPTEIDVDDSSVLGYASFDGRYINPPFLFGSGGVELVAREMTLALLARKQLAKESPGTPVPLVAKGVSFGAILFDADSGTFDTSQVEGIDADLVVRPFGRKGEFATVRGFDVEALAFHFGMQPVEAVGAGVDGDLDGTTDEILVGELSALHVFNTNLERPTIEPLPGFEDGRRVFLEAGCADCHAPVMRTSSSTLSYSFPEDPLDPLASGYYQVDLAAGPAGFAPTAAGGIQVPLFSDLKRHDMGPELAESFGHGLDAQFVTARLWGVADTAPYLHDGRALTLSEAIELHGGEGAAASQAFAALGGAERVALLDFLRSLRTPEDPAADLLAADAP
ncbi:MAG: di-heme oxidoredictase family protein [Planctomycetota bacterium]